MTKSIGFVDGADFGNLLGFVINLKKQFGMTFPETDIEYILSHLNEPGTLVEPEFVEWLQKPEHRRLFEEIRNQREAFMRLKFGDRIAVEREYERFVSGIQPLRKRLWLRWTAVAACVVALLALSLFLMYSREIMTDEKQLAVWEGRKSAELILANGRRIDLENQVIAWREDNGTLVVNDTNHSLSYRRDTLSVSGTGTLEKEPACHTITVPAGADYAVVLADGTRVRLNCETQFRFPVEFKGKERRVFLDGEAFFEVEKAEDWPFIVETDRMKVRVTGTRFNVKSYSAEDRVYTTLVSGSVEVRSDEHSDEPVRLIPAQQYCLDKVTNRVEVKEVDVTLYTGWTEGMFVFKNQRLEEVMNTLSRWYTIEVFYIGETVKDLRVSAHLGRYEHIDSLLEVIRAMDKVNVERKGNVVTVSRK